MNTPRREAGTSGKELDWVLGGGERRRGNCKRIGRGEKNILFDF